MVRIPKRQLSCFILFFGLFFFLTFSLTQRAEGARSGVIRVALLSGEVSVKNPGSESYTAVGVGTKIKFGALVSTSAGSKVQLVFTDGSFVNMSEESLLRIDNYVYDKKRLKRKAFIQVFKGAYRFVFRSMAGNGSLLHIETPAALISARTADIIVSVNDAGTMVLSVDGYAGVRNKSTLVVGLVNVRSSEETFVTSTIAPSLPRAAIRGDIRSWVRKTDMLR